MAKREEKVTDRMRVDGLAAAISTMRARGKSGRYIFRALTLRVQAWEEGFTVTAYNSGRAVGPSSEPHDSIEDALRDLLDVLFRGPAEEARDGE